MTGLCTLRLPLTYLLHACAFLQPSSSLTAITDEDVKTGDPQETLRRASMQPSQIAEAMGPRHSTLGASWRGGITTRQQRKRLSGESHQGPDTPEVRPAEPGARSCECYVQPSLLQLCWILPAPSIASAAVCPTCACPQWICVGTNSLGGWAGRGDLPPRSSIPSSLHSPRSQPAASRVPRPPRAATRSASAAPRAAKRASCREPASR